MTEPIWLGQWAGVWPMFHVEHVAPVMARPPARVLVHRVATRAYGSAAVTAVLESEHRGKTHLVATGAPEMRQGRCAVYQLASDHVDLRGDGAIHVALVDTPEADPLTTLVLDELLASYLISRMPRGSRWSWASPGGQPAP